MDILEEESPMTSMEMTRKSLYEVIKECSDRKIDQKFEFLENRLKIITKCPENKQGSLRSALKSFKYQFKQKWTAVSNKEERFLTKNEQWLNTFITLPAWTTKKAGQPTKEFKELSDQAKRRKTKDLREQIPLEELTYAAQIDTQKFENFAEQTAKLYVDLYEWHPMSPTMHKILRHGATVIDHAILPIGQLSEEAAEARNKHFRMYRQNFSRKFSREDCNKDVLNRLLLTSDPFLSSTRQRQRKKSKPFSVEALELLLPETSYVSSTEFDNEEDDGSSEGDSD